MARPEFRENAQRPTPNIQCPMNATKIARTFENRNSRVGRWALDVECRPLNAGCSQRMTNDEPHRACVRHSSFCYHQITADDALLPRSFAFLDEWREEVDRNRQEGGGVVLAGNLAH